MLGVKKFISRYEMPLARIKRDIGPPDYAHYIFNFAEQVFIPHHARQVGPLYLQYNCLEYAVIAREGRSTTIDEDNSIGYNGTKTHGTKTHGPNSVISVLDHYLVKHGLQENNNYCHLQC